MAARLSLVLLRNGAANIDRSTIALNCVDPGFPKQERLKSSPGKCGQAGRQDWPFGVVMFPFLLPGSQTSGPLRTGETGTWGFVSAWHALSACAKAPQRHHGITHGSPVLLRGRRAGRGKRKQPPCDRSITRSAGTGEDGGGGDSHEGEAQPSQPAAPPPSQWYRWEFQPVRRHHHHRLYQHCTVCRRRFDQMPS